MRRGSQHELQRKPSLNSVQSAPPVPSRDDSSTMRFALKQAKSEDLTYMKPPPPPKELGSPDAPPPLPGRDDTSTFRQALRVMRTRGEEEGDQEEEKGPSLPKRDDSGTFRAALHSMRSSQEIKQLDSSDGMSSSSLPSALLVLEEEPDHEDEEKVEQVRQATLIQRKQALALLKAGKDDESLRLWNAIILVDAADGPEQSDNYAGRAATYLRMGETDNAVSDCLHAINLNERNAKAWGRLGMGYFQAKNYSESVSAFEKCAAIDPKRPELKQKKAAEKLLKQATRRNNRTSRGSSPPPPPSKGTRRSTASSNITPVLSRRSAKEELEKIRVEEEVKKEFDKVKKECPPPFELGITPDIETNKEEYKEYMRKKMIYVEWENNCWRTAQARVKESKP